MTGQGTGEETLGLAGGFQDPGVEAGAWSAYPGRGLTGSALAGREGKGPRPPPAPPR